MYTAKCACQKSEKNFKFDIGPFFIDECCEKAGYDNFGQKKTEGMSNDEISEMAESIDASDLIVKDSITIVEEASAQESNKSKKKNRK